MSAASCCSTVCYNSPMQIHQQLCDHVYKLQAIICCRSEKTCKEHASVMDLVKYQESSSVLGDEIPLRV